MEQGSLERRRGRRINLEVPLLIRGDEARLAQPFQEHVTKNLSLAGVYFETGDGPRFAVNDVVVVSAVIPALQRQEFPFTRVAGKGRIVRVTELEPQAADRKRFGVALEFGDDVTALTAVPARG